MNQLRPLYLALVVVLAGNSALAESSDFRYVGDFGVLPEVRTQNRIEVGGNPFASVPSVPVEEKKSSNAPQIDVLASPNNGTIRKLSEKQFEVVDDRPIQRHKIVGREFRSSDESKMLEEEKLVKPADPQELLGKQYAAEQRQNVKPPRTYPVCDFVPPRNFYPFLKKLNSLP